MVDLDRWLYRGPKTSLDNVIGHSEAKRELRVLASTFERPDIAELVGMPLVSGALISGSPGVGKTLLARAFAASLDRPCYVVPAWELTSAMVSDLYGALSGVPSVIIVDEADIVLRDRTSENAMEGGRVAASLCEALDGIDVLAGPLTIALTASAPWQLDDSILRAGRLTTHIELSNPRKSDRADLWKHYLSRVPATGHLDPTVLATRSAGMVGSDIQATVLAALALSIADGYGTIDADHLYEALDRRGKVEKRIVQSGETTRRVAVHEAGHALAAWLLGGRNAVATVSVVPGNGRHGRVETDEDWTDTVTDPRWIVRIAYAGMLAERIVLGHAAGGGCSSDIAKASSVIARLIDYGAEPSWGAVSRTSVEGHAGSEWQSARSEAWIAIRMISCVEINETERMLSTNSAALLSLAETIHDAGTLSGDALVSAIEAALNSEPADHVERTVPMAHV